MRTTLGVDEVIITAEGYEQLHSELEALRTDGRREASERLREARADAPVDDNPALFDAFEEQARLERRIAALEDSLSMARVAEPNDNGSADIGSVVRLHDLAEKEVVEYTLVGAIEGNPSLGRISVNAPLGRALISATAGQIVSVASPRGELQFEVISVEAPMQSNRKAA